MNCNKDMINDIVSTLKEKGLIDGNKEAETKTALNELWSNSTFIEWSTSDVNQELEELYGDNCISSEDALAVLELAKRKHDREVGISWEVIRLSAQYLAENGKITIKGYQPE